MPIKGFCNAQLVLDNEIRNASLVLDESGYILDVDDADHRKGLLDCSGDYLIPGLVDIHTDNLERQVLPRTKARFPSRSAFLAHDAQCAVAGITTVADALCVGDAGFESQRIQTLRDALDDLADLADQGVLRSEHVLHLRCELPSPNFRDLFDESVARASVHLVSLMDHTPGVGQYANLEKFRALQRAEGLSDIDLQKKIADAQERRERFSAKNREYVLERLRDFPVTIASHDDVTVAEVEQNFADGIRICEFPVTDTAAQRAMELGMLSVGGAPNIVRGGSHSGNIAISDLVTRNLIHALASDYYPSALLEAPFRLFMNGLCSLPKAIAMVTRTPASILGLSDRGSLQPGLRGDIVRVGVFDGQPYVRGVWRLGERVA